MRGRGPWHRARLSRPHRAPRTTARRLRGLSRRQQSHQSVEGGAPLWHGRQRLSPRAGLALVRSRVSGDPVLEPQSLRGAGRLSPRQGLHQRPRPRPAIGQPRRVRTGVLGHHAGLPAGSRFRARRRRAERAPRPLEPSRRLVGCSALRHVVRAHARGAGTPGAHLRARVRRRLPARWPQRSWCGRCCGPCWPPAWS